MGTNNGFGGGTNTNGGFGFGGMNKQGGMNNQVFFNAFHELVIMGPIAFILDFFLIGPFAKKKAFSIVNLERDNNFHLVIAISVVSIIGMCPLMSLAATPALQECGNPVHIRLVPDHSNQLPDGILLADLLCRSVCKICFGKLFPEKERTAASAE